jgi:predicted acyltransferase (DUF342 family)
MYPKFNYKGYGLFEKIRLWRNLDKLNFKVTTSFQSKDVIIRENTIFTGHHLGIFKIMPNVHFIFRGKLTGNMTISKDSKVDFFGEVIGNVNSEHILYIRNKSSIKGNITSKKLIIETGAQFEGQIKLQ